MTELTLLLATVDTLLTVVDNRRPMELNILLSELDFFNSSAVGAVSKSKIISIGLENKVVINDTNTEITNTVLIVNFGSWYIHTNVPLF